MKQIRLTKTQAASSGAARSSVARATCAARAATSTGLFPATASSAFVLSVCFSRGPSTLPDPSSAVSGHIVTRNCKVAPISDTGNLPRNLGHRFRFTETMTVPRHFFGNFTADAVNLGPHPALFHAPAIHPDLPRYRPSTRSNTTSFANGLETRHRTTRPLAFRMKTALSNRPLPGARNASVW